MDKHSSGSGRTEIAMSGRGTMERRLAVQYPMGIKQMSGFAFLTLYAVYALLRGGAGSGLWPVYGTWMLLCGGTLIYLFLRRRLGRPRLQIGADTLTANGAALRPDRIRVIRMDRDLFGIVPEGRRIAPTTLCLRIVDLEDRKALIRWATSRGVEIREGTFLRWL
ncbi:hypothetical protein [Cohnella nanjingensis]|uniref:Uncharacterized protein n=1 Tax=Cohnella nanjingensis TaxID=1387779 RepID=A0A7X0RQ84_9BACL|nr:hypothetical protein [Cohnella nanjingensis]MBB6671642.1 hypothetical protein [Cohnella nanjingensis]